MGFQSYKCMKVDSSAYNAQTIDFATIKKAKQYAVSFFGENVA